MKLRLIRIASGGNDTIGVLYAVDDAGNHSVLAFTLEDEERAEKVRGETRIPAGVYEVRLRAEGGHHKRYAEKFPDIHRGMLHLQDVPGFKWILIHIGNTDDDTAGCILVGNSALIIGCSRNIQRSTAAYRRVYAACADAAGRGDLQIEVMNFA